MLAWEIAWLLMRERIEEGGTEPAITLLRCLAAALDADVHLTAGQRPRIGVVRTPRSLTR